jgi:hypothetical protein
MGLISSCENPGIEISHPGASDYIEIYDAATFNKLREHPGSKFRIIRSFSLPNEPFQPIENFTGILDGMGNSIKNLRLIDGEAENIGLFANLTDAVIKNLQIETAENRLILTRSQDQFVGILAARIRNSFLENIRITGSEIKIHGESWNLLVGALAATIENTSVFRVGITIDMALNSKGTHQTLSGLVAHPDQVSTVKEVVVLSNLDSDGHWCYVNLLSGGGIVIDSMAIGKIQSKATGAAYSAGVFSTGVIERCAFFGSIINENEERINNALCFNAELVKNVVSVPSLLVAGNSALISREQITDVTLRAPLRYRNISKENVLINGKATTGNDLNGEHGLGKSIKELQQETTYTAIGWNFNQVWKMGGASFPYPVLRWLGDFTLPAGYEPVR